MQPISSNQPVQPTQNIEIGAYSKGVKELPSLQTATLEQKAKPKSFHKEFDQLLTISLKPDTKDQKAGAVVAPYIFLSDRSTLTLQTFKAALKNI
ncbi:MAG TPA: hypothetical protein PLC42_08085 [Parachlamydiaceae bacterium]|nr:hypothetical protein [Parachlamydiaceae bacterium]